MHAEAQSPPYSTYASLVAIFAAGMAGVGALAGLRGRDPEQLTALDLAVLSAATFKAAHVVAHDEVTSFLRAPFVQGEARRRRAAGRGRRPAAGARRAADV